MYYYRHHNHYHSCCHHHVMVRNDGDDGDDDNVGNGNGDDGDAFAGDDINVRCDDTGNESDSDSVHDIKDGNDPSADAQHGFPRLV